MLALQGEYRFRDKLHVILRDAQSTEGVQLRRAIDSTRKEGRSVDRMLVDLREMRDELIEDYGGSVAWPGPEDLR